MKNRITICLIVLAALSVMQAQPGLSPEAQKAMNAIDAEKIRATVKYLADDALEGRGTGQRGGDKAADWIAAQFKSYGLLPAGDHGTYFQKVGFYGVTTDPQQTRFAFIGKDGAETVLKFADDFVATDQTH